MKLAQSTMDQLNISQHLMEAILDKYLLLEQVPSHHKQVDLALMGVNDHLSSELSHLTSELNHWSKSL